MTVEEDEAAQARKFGRLMGVVIGGWLIALGITVITVGVLRWLL